MRTMGEAQDNPYYYQMALNIKLVHRNFIPN